MEGYGLLMIVCIATHYNNVFQMIVFRWEYVFQKGGDHRKRSKIFITDRVCVFVRVHGVARMKQCARCESHVWINYFSGLKYVL